MKHCGVFIGRFQPVHKAHLETITHALERFDELVMLIGSAHRARSVKNPFSYDERKQMLEATLGNTDSIHFAPIEDRYYNEALWCQDVRDAVTRCSKTDQVSIIGHDKDPSSYYLRLFPEWTWVDMPCLGKIDATDIRAQWFEGKAYSDALCPTTIELLQAFEHDKPEDFQRLQQEHAYVTTYKASWAQSPFPPIFVTVDALVTCLDHVLIIQRKNSPGQGLWALPGGYIEPHEWVHEGILRELIEETSIDVSPEKLQIEKITVYDHPQRGLLGRMITHLGHIPLSQDALPTIKADDDALDAKWWPIADLALLKEQCHDDHYLILCDVLMS